jgi:hypothetical protein
VKGPEYKSGCSRHPYFAARTRKLVVTGDEAAQPVLSILVMCHSVARDLAGLVERGGQVSQY